FPLSRRERGSGGEDRCARVKTARVGDRYQDTDTWKEDSRRVNLDKGSFKAGPFAARRCGAPGQYVSEPHGAHRAPAGARRLHLVSVRAIARLPVLGTGGRTALAVPCSSARTSGARPGRFRRITTASCSSTSSCGTGSWRSPWTPV